MDAKGGDAEGSASAVFLSYSSDDIEPAARIRDALQAARLEVWFDKEELRGGDAWDAAIRKQIRECAFFVPIVSASTQARREGYFRLEWKLAADRSQLMSDDQAFILPVAIDSTPEATARVPDRFRELQWSRVHDDRSRAAFAERVRALASGVDDRPLRAGVARIGAKSAPTPAREHPRWWIAAAASALLLCAGTVAVLKLRPAATPAPAATRVADTRMAFAVIPLTAPDGDGEAARFADAMTEALVGGLAESPVSRVVSRESVQSALRRNPSPREIGRTLGVGYLLRGLVKRQGESFVAALSVIGAEGEQVLGTEEISWPSKRPLDARRTEIGEPLTRLTGPAYRREIQETKRKKPEELDARDLAYLADDAWDRSGSGYEAAMSYLRRAQALAPDDRLVLSLVAKVNLCECRRAFSKDPQEQERIGAEAVEQYLSRHPNDPKMLEWKLEINTMRGRFEDSLVILDRLLEKNPDDSRLLGAKAYNLNKLGRVDDALVAAEAALRHDPSSGNRLHLAILHFKLGHHDRALDFARKGIAEMPGKDRLKGWSGAVLLVRIGAAANLGQRDQVQVGLQDFRAAAPGVDTIAKIRKWVDARSGIAGHEPLYTALRKAGIPD